MGSAWMLLAGASFACMGALVKLASAWFSSHELVFYRSVFALLLIAAVLFLRVRREAFGHLAGEHFWVHVRRGLVGFVALVAFFYSLAKLPMSMAMTLNYTSPLFLALMMPVWLHERPRPLQYVAVALGFAGVVLLLRPWEGHGDVLAGLAGLFSGFMAGLAYVHVRALGRLHEPEWRTVFWFAAVSCVGAALLAGVQGWNAQPGGHWLLLLGLGAMATLGQFSMTRAYKRGNTVVVAALAYSTVVFSCLLDVVIWKVEIPPIAWLGVCVTVAAGIWAATLNPEKTA